MKAGVDLGLYPSPWDRHEVILIKVCTRQELMLVYNAIMKLAGTAIQLLSKPQSPFHLSADDSTGMKSFHVSVHY
ncbi:hypothetical protein DKX38_006696 [Salix brachista]|uniref:Uncharacterized protein n=1 Tax=Salix brachista TaxID=2182728 RepID=A0A5N5N305_9ROSI|nr:hypothetical protein DKX38_006696 [Salix brachista]